MPYLMSWGLFLAQLFFDKSQIQFFLSVIRLIVLIFLYSLWYYIALHKFDFWSVFIPRMCGKGQGINFFFNCYMKPLVNFCAEFGPSLVGDCEAVLVSGVSPTLSDWRNPHMWRNMVLTCGSGRKANQSPYVCNTTLDSSKVAYAWPTVKFEAC